MLTEGRFVVPAHLYFSFAMVESPSLEFLTAQARMFYGHSMANHRSFTSRFLGILSQFDAHLSSTRTALPASHNYTQYLQFGVIVPVLQSRSHRLLLIELGFKAY